MTDDEHDIPPDGGAAEQPTEGAPGQAADEAAENPLHRKLGIRAGSVGAIVAAPEEDGLLAPLPQSFVSLRAIADLVGHEGAFDYLHFFARSRADLVKDFPVLRDKLAPGGSLWISWIKQTSARRGGGLPGDLNENTIRRLALASGLVDVKVASLDAEWSALKLVWRRH